MPRAWTAGDREYVIDYRPVTDSDQQLAKLVVTVSDVTELRQHEQAEQKQRELVSVFSAIIRDRAGFMSFYDDARLLIDRMAAPGPHVAYDLTAHLHTIKGNAFLFRLRELGVACEQVETLCAAEGRLPSAEDAACLAQALSSSVSPVEQFLALERGQNVQMSQQDYRAILHALHANETASQVSVRLQLATAEAAELVFGRFAEQLHVLARRLGKCPVKIQCEGHGLRFPRETFGPLWSVVVHVLRNIADHGLETPREREQCKKPPDASVVLSASVAQSTLAIRFRDDGRGIDWQNVRVRAEQRGLAFATRADLRAALLSQSFSTLAETSALSGRGVGLAALQDEVTSLGGTVHIDGELGQGTELAISLPASLVAY
jgi:two-component system chemotaxis sensor kinase CheA